MNATSERIVINSSSTWEEVGREQWEETRTGYVFDRNGAEATIDYYSGSPPKGSPGAAWQIVPIGRMAKARVGSDFLHLLRQVSAQPLAISSAVKDLAGRPGWNRFGGSEVHQALICAFSGGSVELALAPDDSTPLEAFVPESALFFQRRIDTSLVGAWLPDLINHLRLREPS